MENKGKYYKSIFITYFDGGYEDAPTPDVPTTMQMGVCKLEYIRKENKLMVHLRRPSLLIGRKGRLLNALQEYLGIEIGIIEVDLMK